MTPKPRDAISRHERAATLEAEFRAAVALLDAFDCPGGWRYLQVWKHSRELNKRRARVNKWLSERWYERQRKEKHNGN
jgi:hypothetical protein